MKQKDCNHIVQTSATSHTDVTIKAINLPYNMYSIGILLIPVQNHYGYNNPCMSRLILNHISGSENIRGILVDTSVDTLKIIPFLFITYLFIEYFEHKASDKVVHTLQKSSKFGPLFGSVAGLFPQCGFSTIASSFYVNRFVTFGTLIAVYLTTSDEMIPVLLTIDPALIPPILGIKLLVGIIAGFTIDLLLRKREVTPHAEILCEQEQCSCSDDGILKGAIKHTVRIGLYIFLITLGLNILLSFIDLQSLFTDIPLLGLFIAAIIGLIPNCATSIVITQLYAGGTLSFGVMMAGLLTNGGVGILMLFRINKNLRENITILGILVGIAVTTGSILNILL